MDHSFCDHGYLRSNSVLTRIIFGLGNSVPKTNLDVSFSSALIQVLVHNQFYTIRCIVEMSATFRLGMVLNQGNLGCHFSVKSTPVNRPVIRFG